MSDLISSSALIKRIRDYADEVGCIRGEYELANGILKSISVVEEAPAVEAKPVVHCKDCEHWGTGVAGETEHVKCCEYGKYLVGENGYCCYADMRGEKHD